MIVSSAALKSKTGLFLKSGGSPLLFVSTTLLTRKKP
jgi:hypothetical protein